MSTENTTCYTWGGGAASTGSKIEMLLNILRCTAHFTAKCHPAQISQLGLNGNVDHLGILFKFT
jgi:hypothetical protein